MKFLKKFNEAELTGDVEVDSNYPVEVPETPEVQHLKKINSMFVAKAPVKDIINYAIDNNVDLDYEDGLLIRTAAKDEDISSIQLLIDNGANVNIRRLMAFRWACEWAKLAVIPILFEAALGGDYSLEKVISEGVYWTMTSDKCRNKMDVCNLFKKLAPEKSNFIDKQLEKYNRR